MVGKYDVPQINIPHGPPATRPLLNIHTPITIRNTYQLLSVTRTGVITDRCELVSNIFWRNTKSDRYVDYYRDGYNTGHFSCYE